MVFFESPLYMKLLGVSGMGAFTSIATFFVWTKHCDVQDLPVTDPLFRSSFYKQFNPRENPSMRDVCVRRLPLYQIRPDLLEDDKRGGGRLVEAFCGGIYGGTGKDLLLFGDVPLDLFGKGIRSREMMKLLGSRTDTLL